MFSLKSIAAAVLGAVACTACVSTQRTPADAPPAPAEAAYILGKQQLALHHEQLAEQAFQRAIAADPAHAEAANALGVLYFGQGRFALAEAQFKHAVELAPARAHLLGNLGYLYLETGRTALAQSVLNEARALDPQNARVQAHLARAREALAKQAPPPVTPPADPAVAATDADDKTTTLREVAPNVWEMRAPAPSAAAAPVPAAPRTAGRIEVSNGLGVNGMARRVGHYLAVQGYAPSRTTNQEPYGQARTEIQYVPGQRALAVKLSSLFANRPKLVAAASLDRQMQLRLVIGRGFVEPAAEGVGQAAGAP